MAIFSRKTKPKADNTPQQKQLPTGRSNVTQLQSHAVLASRDDVYHAPMTDAERTMERMAIQAASRKQMDNGRNASFTSAASKGNGNDFAHSLSNKQHRHSERDLRDGQDQQAVVSDAARYRPEQYSPPKHIRAVHGPMQSVSSRSRGSARRDDEKMCMLPQDRLNARPQPPKDSAHSSTAPSFDTRSSPSSTEPPRAVEGDLANRQRKSTAPLPRHAVSRDNVKVPVLAQTSTVVPVRSNKSRDNGGSDGSISNGYVSRLDPGPFSSIITKPDVPINPAPSQQKTGMSDKSAPQSREGPKVSRSVESAEVSVATRKAPRSAQAVEEAITALPQASIHPAFRASVDTERPRELTEPQETTSKWANRGVDKRKTTAPATSPLEPGETSGTTQPRAFSLRDAITQLRTPTSDAGPAPTTSEATAEEPRTQSLSTFRKTSAEVVRKIAKSPQSTFHQTSAPTSATTQTTLPPAIQQPRQVLPESATPNMGAAASSDRSADLSHSQWRPAKSTMRSLPTAAPTTDLVSPISPSTPIAAESSSTHRSAPGESALSTHAREVTTFQEPGVDAPNHTNDVSRPTLNDYSSTTIDQRPTLPPLSALEGFKVNRRGQVLDEEGEVIGRLAEGELLDCVRRIVNAKGEVFDEYGGVVGRAITVLREATSPVVEQAFYTPPMHSPAPGSFASQKWSALTEAPAIARAPSPVFYAELDASEEVQAGPALDHSEVFQPGFLGSFRSRSPSATPTQSTVQTSRPSTQTQPSSISEEKVLVEPHAPKKWASRYFETGPSGTAPASASSSTAKAPTTTPPTSQTKLRPQSESLLSHPKTGQTQRAVLGATYESLREDLPAPSRSRTFSSNKIALENSTLTRTPTSEYAALTSSNFADPRKSVRVGSAGGRASPSANVARRRASSASSRAPPMSSAKHQPFVRSPLSSIPTTPPEPFDSEPETTQRPSATVRNSKVHPPPSAGQSSTRKFSFDDTTIDENDELAAPPPIVKKATPPAAVASSPATAAAPATSATASTAKARGGKRMSFFGLLGGRKFGREDRVSVAAH